MGFLTKLFGGNRRLESDAWSLFEVAEAPFQIAFRCVTLDGAC